MSSISDLLADLEANYIYSRLRVKGKRSPEDTVGTLR